MAKALVVVGWAVCGTALLIADHIYAGWFFLILSLAMGCAGFDKLDRKEEK